MKKKQSREEDQYGIQHKYGNINRENVAGVLDIYQCIIVNMAQEKKKILLDRDLELEYSLCADALALRYPGKMPICDNTLLLCYSYSKISRFDMVFVTIPHRGIVH